MNLIRTSLLALILFLSGAIPAQAGLIAISFLGDVFNIDPLTGTETFVGATGFIATNSLARDPVTGTLYSLSTAGLITIDPATGAGTLIGGSGFAVHGLAFSPDGVLYAVRDALSGPDVLLRIDPLTGDRTDIGNIGGFGLVSALTFLGDVLYGYDTRATAGLFTIDPNTGLGVDLPAGTEFFQNVQGMGASADGTFIWGIGRSFGGGMVHLDPVTGLETPVLPRFANDYRGVEDLGIIDDQDISVPEPGTFALLITGLIAFGLRFGIRSQLRARRLQA